MTFASVRAAAEHIARVGSISPHQLAALSRLDELLTEAQRAEFTQLWRAAGSPAGPVPELVTMAQATAVFLRAPTAAQLADLNGCLRRFEINTPARIAHFMAQIGHESGGLRWMTELASGEAYEGRQDLGNTQKGDGVRFKGAGALQLTGRHNYQRFADFIKDPRVMEGASYVASVYPFTSAGFWWHQNGMNAMVDRGATCRQVSARVNGRDPANGLQDREAYFSRAVEAFGSLPKLELPAQQPSGSVLLKVPYFSQRDNLSGQGERECASSSAAMVAAFYGKVAGDDAYNVIRAKFGDTTDVNAHVQALRSLGLDARFRTDGTPATLEAELRAGRPVMVGWLHHGPASKPTGGGHYSVVVGFTDTHWIQNDPYGEADMVNGGYVSAKGGAGIRYTRRNWERRWLPDGKGWCLLARPI